MHRITGLAVLLLLPASLAFAQRATLTGRVTDQTGAVVPGAAITITEQDSGVATRTSTNAEGIFVAPSLLPGTYRVEARHTGFQPLLRSDVLLEVQQTARLDLTLTVGESAQAIEVTEAAAPLLTESAAVESTVSREQIETLPLNSRDFNQLVLLAAGAVENINSGNGRDFGAVAVNGNRAFSNDYLLDGVANNDLYQGRSAIPVSIDLIREFKVTSAVAPAEYGQAGTQISVVSRAGTNRFRGSVFEYYRGTALQARNPFSVGPLPPFSRHQFGGSLGGPVLRNRTFFFFNYEGNRQRETATRVATVPLDEFWRGDFSSLLERRIQLRDPLLPERPLIPGNRLDQYLSGARLNATARKLQPYWGSPNLSGLTNNAVREVQEPTNAHQFTTRLDQILPANHSLGLRYTQSIVDNFGPSILANGSGLDRPTDNYNGSLTWTAPLRPHLVNEFRFGGAHYNSLTRYDAGGLPTVESLGLRGFETGDEFVPPMPRISFTGGDAFTQLNYGTSANFGMASLKRLSTTWTVANVTTWTHGRHSVKGGFEHRKTSLPALQQTNARGTVNFRAASTGLSTGYAFADFLMGLPGSTQEVPLKADVILKQDEISSFIQDDWRVTSRLTLSLGLRHELFLNPVEERNRIAMFDIVTGAMVVATSDGRLPVSEYLPAIVSKLADAQGRFPFPVISDVEAGLQPRRVLETKYNYFGPRIGFIFQPDRSRRTIVHGGYGVFYTRYPRQYLLQTLFINPPFAGVFNYSQTNVNGQPLLSLDAPFPEARGNASVSPAGMQRDFGLPYNQQWNLTIERNIGWDTVVSLGYTGNRGVHLFRSINANATRLDSATGQIVRRFQGTYGTSTINFRQMDGNSIYNAMLLEVRRRTRGGLIFQGNWTWAKGLDDTGQTVQAALLDVENLGRDRADSDYVRRHQVTINSTWELPFGRGRLVPIGDRWLEAAAGGWRLAGIWRFTTGRYFTPLFTTTGGLSNNRPDVVPGVSANLPRGERRPERWFNPAAFSEVPAADPSTGRPRFGNAGRNILVGPGLNTMDASLAKSFRFFGERGALSLRLEAFNVLNTPNYDQPANNISQSNLAGTISDIVLPMRQVQFAVRYDF